MVFSLTGMILGLFLHIVVLVCCFQKGISTKTMIGCDGSYLDCFHIKLFSIYCCFALLLPKRYQCEKIIGCSGSWFDCVNIKLFLLIVAWVCYFQKGISIKTMTGCNGA